MLTQTSIPIPELQAAQEKLQSTIDQAQAEVAGLKAQIKSWKKILRAMGMTPNGAKRKKGDL